MKPIVALDLAGEEGNAFVIVSQAAAALKEVDPARATEYLSRATSGDYDTLLAVTREYVDLIDTRAAIREYIANHRKGEPGD